MQKYSPKTPQKFWCNICDAHIVDSEDIISGSFYTQFGHSYNKAEKDYTGEYVGVMFAVCKHCQKEHNFTY